MQLLLLGFKGGWYLIASNEKGVISGSTIAFSVIISTAECVSLYFTNIKVLSEIELDTSALLTQ